MFENFVTNIYKCYVISFDLKKSNIQYTLIRATQTSFSSRGHVISKELAKHIARTIEEVSLLSLLLIREGNSVRESMMGFLIIWIIPAELIGEC